MDDKFLKYSKLYGYIFFALFAFVIGVALLIATFYGFSKILSSRPVDVAFELIVIGILFGKYLNKDSIIYILFISS